ncbi:MAG: hypothetical protein RR598_06545 [Anaerorhabdus sp.]|uniref:hypothetical protein n=1 Tax=Anaerorhabdus sp. TaxID=1872524 RepID=UPI002FCB4020
MKYKETVSFDNGSVVAVNDIVVVVNSRSENFIGRIDKIELGIIMVPMIRIDMSEKFQNNVVEIKIADIVNINLFDKEHK